MLLDRPDLQGRCGTCARFVRVVEEIDGNGEVKRRGECLLGVWPPPLLETSTCNDYVKKGTFTGKLQKPARVARPRGASPVRAGGASKASPLTLPEELMDMDADEFRKVLREVIQEELGPPSVELGGRWQGGELVMVPGKEGTGEKRVPLESFFHKIVMIRERLRVLEQKINNHDMLTDEDKVQLQQYVTQCYGTLTTFNVLFADKNDGFTGQKSD